jgi:hypothetical protein
MKTQILKKVLPLLAVVIAITGALAFDSKNAIEEASWEHGYINTTTPCSMPVVCSTAPGLECTNSAGQIVYGLDNSSGTSCTKPLFRF